ncbi:hypothetical protein [Gelidibacter salicanalis]|uniref:Uncharacterized protein n=1 Tax=Gelidibacter salicanalis TaxID=291193 RepID=A0A934KRS5_9FLAO|nr:hypothetical protein [Gelidibacter salicanalis]MBJ7880880.1 hypothetical protein [Gelidibacter salicanalis]
MKIASIILSIIALGFIGFNVTKLDFNNLFQGDSMVAIITILTALCAIILLQILRISKRIDTLSKQKRNA